MEPKGIENRIILSQVGSDYLFKILIIIFVFLGTAEGYAQDLAKGIDISKYQGKIVNDIKIGDSLSFVICKATEGITYIDPDFEFNWKTIKSKDLIRGTYHFYRTNDDPIKQANAYLEAIATLDSLDLSPILDIEQGGVVGNPTIEAVQKDILIWLETVEKEICRRPIIYSGVSFANTWLNNKSFSKYPIWLAEYTSKEFPNIPNQWKNIGYAFWQKTDDYAFNSEKTDFDIFNGNHEKLLQFIKQY